MGAWGSGGAGPRRAYVAWTRAAGPFWQYVAGPPFLGCLTRRPAPGPVVAGRRTVERAILPLFSGTAERVALLLDLPPELGLAMTPAFQGAGWLVVPIILRWPARDAVLPVEGVLSQLVWLAGRLRRPADPAGVAFVLDGARAGPKRPARLKRSFDNRYDYSAHPFPPAEALRAWGVRTVGIVGHDRRIADDLTAVVESFRQGGLAASHIWVQKSESSAVATSGMDRV